MQIWEAPEVLAAIVGAGGNILAATIAAIAAALIGRRFLNQEALKQKLQVAVSDIKFLTEVENIHVGQRRETESRSTRRDVRQIAKRHGFVWSGKFIPSRWDRYD